MRFFHINISISSDFNRERKFRKNIVFLEWIFYLNTTTPLILLRILVHTIRFFELIFESNIELSKYSQPFLEWFKNYLMIQLVVPKHIVFWLDKISMSKQALLPVFEEWLDSLWNEKSEIVRSEVLGDWNVTTVFNGIIFSENE